MFGSRIPAERRFNAARCAFASEGGDRIMNMQWTFSPSARSVLSSLLQYNSSNHSFSSNVRFRWEYSPGSDLFLVYSDGRDTSADGFPRVRDRSLAIKVTRFLRF